MSSSQSQQNRDLMPAAAELIDQWRETVKGTPLQGAELHYVADDTTGYEWRDDDGKRID